MRGVQSCISWRSSGIPTRTQARTHLACAAGMRIEAASTPSATRAHGTHARTRAMHAFDPSPLRSRGACVRVPALPHSFTADQASGGVCMSDQSAPGRFGLKLTFVLSVVQVLQVPVAPGQRDAWVGDRAREALAQISAPTSLGPSSEHIGHPSLQVFLQSAGALFGCDPEKWERQGRPKTEYSEAKQIRHALRTCAKLLGGHPRPSALHRLALRF
jgi:hypothetical protein